MKDKYSNILARIQVQKQRKDNIDLFFKNFLGEILFSQIKVLIVNIKENSENEVLIYLKITCSSSLKFHLKKEEEKIILAFFDQFNERLILL